MKKIFFFLIISISFINSAGSLFAHEYDLVWTNRIDGPRQMVDRGHGITHKNGFIYTVGMVADFDGLGGYNMYTAKYNIDGFKTWSKIYTSPGSYLDLGNAIALDSDDNIYIAGESDDAGGSRILLQKMDNNGSIVWSKTINGDSGINNFGSGIVTYENNVYITGTINKTGNSLDIFLARYDLDGNQKWKTNINSLGSKMDLGEDVSVDNYGNIYVIGTVKSGSNIYIAKFDTNRNALWEKTIQCGGDGTGQGILVDDHYNIYATGSVTASGQKKMWVCNITNSKWTNIINFPGGQEGLDIISDQQGNIYIPASDGIVKLDPHGVLISKTNGLNQNICGLCLDESKNFYCIGDNTAASIDLTIKKYSCDLEIDTVCLPLIEAKKYYSYGIKATGGKSPYTWSIINSSLPDWLTLSSQGILAGVPDKNTNTRIKVQVNEANGGYDTKSFALSAVEDILVIPDKVKIVGGQNGYINPDIDEKAVIWFNNQIAGTVSIKIYAATGELVKEFSQQFSAGLNSTSWNGKNIRSQTVASGIYFVYIEGCGIMQKLKIAVGR